jgi:hypothetical protein
MNFCRTGSMASPRDAHAAAPLETSLSKAEVYDARKGRFARRPTMTTNRYKHAAVPLGGGAALVVGGSDSRDFKGRYASAERYYPRTRRFRRVGASLASATATVLRDGRVLVAGDFDDSIRAAWVFTP